jgi:hypothetical protein
MFREARYARFTSFQIVYSSPDPCQRLAAVWQSTKFPIAARLAPGSIPSFALGGVRVRVDLHVRLRRPTKTNKVRIGGIMLRYSKGKALPVNVGLWQSAFLHGYLLRTGIDPDVSPDPKLCITYDVCKGLCHAAPTNSV